MYIHPVQMTGQSGHQKGVILSCKRPDGHEIYYHYSSGVRLPSTSTSLKHHKKPLISTAICNPHRYLLK